MTILKTLRWSAALGGALLVGLSLLTPAAHAQTSTTTVDIRTGNKGEAVGTATFTRTADASGNETLTVELNVAGGIDESHVCISDEPFSSRIATGSCPYAQGATGTSASFVIPLGTTYVGEPLYVQAGVVTDDSTAFAGWQDGKPFFGNVRIEAVIGTDPVPGVNLIGGVAFTVLLAVLLVVGMARRRPTARTLA